MFFKEFSSQLPHDGGAFYTTDTIELSRPHYTATWPPILLAASFWLNSGNFDAPRTIETRKNESSIKDSAEDRFYLLFGKTWTFFSSNLRIQFHIPNLQIMQFS